MTGSKEKFLEIHHSRVFSRNFSFLSNSAFPSSPTKSTNLKDTMNCQRRGSTELIIAILESARKGATISTLSQINSFAGVKRYLAFLVKNGLLRLEKSHEYLVAADGREYGLFYFTTEKGFELLRKYDDLLALLSEEKREVTGCVLPRF